MTRLLLKKYVNESALLLSACAFMLVMFCWARVWIVCQFDLTQLEPLLAQLRPFEKFMPVPLEQMLTYTGSIAMTFHEPVLILCILVWAVARGSDVVSGELGRGTLEMMLAQPISRIRVMLCHAAVCVGGLALLCAAVWLGLYAGIQTNTVSETLTPAVNLKIPFLPVEIPVPLGASSTVRTPLAERVDATLYVAPVCNLFGFGFFVWALSVLCSSFDRYRWRTIGVVIGIYVVQLLLFLLSKATEFTAFCGRLTFLTCYQPDAIVQLARTRPQTVWSILMPGGETNDFWPSRLAPLGLTAVLLVLGCLFFTGAVLRFRSRDLPAPL